MERAAQTLALDARAVPEVRAEVGAESPSDDRTPALRAVDHHIAAEERPRQDGAWRELRGGRDDVPPCGVGRRLHCDGRRH
jgi:hypothetical protein